VHNAGGTLTLYVAKWRGCIGVGEGILSVRFTMYNKQAMWRPSHCLVYEVPTSNTEIITNLRISRQCHSYVFSFSGYQSVDNQTVAAEQQTTNDNLFRIPTSSQITPLKRSNSGDKYCCRSKGR